MGRKGKRPCVNRCRLSSGGHGKPLIRRCARWSREWSVGNPSPLAEEGARRADEGYAENPPQTYPRDQNRAHTPPHHPGLTGGAAATSGPGWCRGGTSLFAQVREPAARGERPRRAITGTVPKTGNPGTVIVSYFTTYEAKAVSGSARSRQPHHRRRFRLPKPCTTSAGH